MKYAVVASCGRWPTEVFGPFETHERAEAYISLLTSECFLAGYLMAVVEMQAPKHQLQCVIITELPMEQSL